MSARWLASALLFGTAMAQPLNALVELPDLEPADGVVRVALTAAGGGVAPFQYRYAEGTPVIRARRGDMLVVDLNNQLDTPTTVHWHGVEVPWAMDGVTWMTDPIAAGAEFTYQFELTQAGTFWFHPHFDTDAQVDGGLYGVLVVEDPAEPAADDEITLVFDIAGEHDEHAGHADSGPAFGHGQLMPQWRVNGALAPATYAAASGSTVRVRVVNVASAGYLSLRWPGLRRVAGDQGLLPQLDTPETFVMGPGDRAEFEWLVGAEPFTVETLAYSLNGGAGYGDPVALVEVQPTGGAPAPAGLAWPFQAAEPTADPPYTDVLYAFAGSDRTRKWLINGERFPAVTVESIQRGEATIIEVRNVSPTEHPFHLHGMRFEVLSTNGRPPAFRTMEDTLNLAIRDRVRLRVVPPNPGDWMAHCHILPHAEDGMMTVLRVE